MPNNSNNIDLLSLVDDDFDLTSFTQPDVTDVPIPFLPTQPTLRQGRVAPIQSGTLDVPPDLLTIDNPNFEDQTKEDQERARSLFLIHGYNAVLQAGLEPPKHPHGVLAGFGAGLARGFAPTVPEEQDIAIRGESPAISGIGRAVGEIGKFAALRGLGAGGLLGDVLVGGGIAGARQLGREEPSVEEALFETVGVFAGSGFVRSVAQGARPTFSQFADDVVKAPTTQQRITAKVTDISGLPKVTPPLQRTTPQLKTGSPFLDNTTRESQILNFFGYNPEIAQTVQKAWSKAVDKSVEAATSIVPERIQTTLRSFFISPAPEEARQILRNADKFTAQGKQVASEIADNIRTNVPKEFHDDLFRTLDPTAFGDIGNLPKEYRSVARVARDKIDDLGAQYAELGLIDEATFTKNVGEYLGRYYSLSGKPFSAIRQAFRRNFIRGERGKHRVLKTVAEREKAGLINDPAYAVSRTVGDLTFDIGNARAFQTIAKNPNWVQPVETFATASEASDAGFALLPKNRAYGDLSGQWVDKGIISELNTMVPNYSNKVTQNPVWREAVDLYDIMLTGWKFGKTALNPATHGRNLFSNVILADLGGLSVLGDQPRWLPKALLEYKGRGKLYNEAANAGLFGTDWYGAEVGSFGKAIGRGKKSGVGLITDLVTNSKAGGLVSKAGTLYQAEEHWFKMAMFMQRRNLGDDISTAAAHAQKHLFNYNDLSPALKGLRRSPFGGPFLSFTAKSLPVLAETAVKHPIRFFKWPLMFDAVNEISKKQIGMTDEEYDRMQASLPEWQKNTWLTPKILLPARGQEGSPRILDMTYNLPWGQIGEQGKLFKNVPFLRDLPAGALVDPFIGSNPFTNLVAEGIFNKSLFNDREIFNKRVDTDVRAAQKLGKHAFRQLAPGIVLNVPAVVKAIKGDTDRFGVKFDPLSTALSKLAGIKIIDVNIDQNTKFKLIEFKKTFDEIIREAYRVAGNKSLSKEEVQSEVDFLKSRVDQLSEDYKQFGGKKTEDKTAEPDSAVTTDTTGIDITSF